MTRSKLWERAAVSAWLCFWFVFVYNGCNYLASLRPDVGTCAYDWEINFFPFIPILIIPYWSIDLFYGVAPFLIKDRFQLKQHLKRITFGIAVAGFFFLVFPLKLVTPAPPVLRGSAKLSKLLQLRPQSSHCAPNQSPYGLPAPLSGQAPPSH